MKNMHQGTKDMHDPKLIKEQLTLRSKKESKTQHDLIDCKCDALWDLVPFLQFKKREKHPCRSITFSKVAGFSILLLKVTLLHGCFQVF